MRLTVITVTFVLKTQEFLVYLTTLTQFSVIKCLTLEHWIGDVGRERTAFERLYYVFGGIGRESYIIL